MPTKSPQTTLRAEILAAQKELDDVLPLMAKRMTETALTAQSLRDRRAAVKGLRELADYLAGRAAKS
jgi:hypothetical protein